MFHMVWGTLAFAGAEVSGFNKISSEGPTFYDAPSAVDERIDTAWMTAADSENDKEWIQIDGPNFASKLTQVRVINGYAKDEQSFKDYTKIKKLMIEVYEYNNQMQLYPTKRTVEIELKNTPEPQIIKLPKPLEVKSSSGGKYRFTISEVYKTNTENYPDNIALTEISLYLEDQKFSPRIEEEENVIEGEDVFLLLDDSTRKVYKMNSETILGFDGGDNSITRLAIKPTTDRRYARPKKIKVSVGGREVIQDLPEKTPKSPIWIWLPSVTGYPGGSSWDTTYVQVLETYPGKKYPEIGLTEIYFQALISADPEGIDP